MTAERKTIAACLLEEIEGRTVEEATVFLLDLIKGYRKDYWDFRVDTSEEDFNITALPLKSKEEEKETIEPYDYL